MKDTKISLGCPFTEILVKIEMLRFVPKQIEKSAGVDSWGCLASI
jgi:hypothetical protein